LSEDRTSVNLYDWARPKLERVRIYRQHSLYWNVLTALLSAVVYAVSYYYYGDWLFSVIPVVVLVITSLALKEERLDYPTVTTKQEIYALLLVSIADLAQNVQKAKKRMPLSDFDAAIAKLVRRMAPDIEKYRGELTASGSRALRILDMLQTFVLKFASVVAKVREADRDSPSFSQLSTLLSGMTSTIVTAANTFYRFHDIGDDLLYRTLEADLDSQEIASTDERVTILGPSGAVFRSFSAYRQLPTPIHLIVWAVVVAVLALLGNVCFPQPVGWVAIAVGAYSMVLMYFKESLKEWLRLRL